MPKLLSKAYAENQYAATQKKNKQDLNAREVEEKARAEHVSELKAQFQLFLASWIAQLGAIFVNWSIQNEGRCEMVKVAVSTRKCWIA